MMKANQYDAVVVGSGPNGLSGAITLAQKGLSVLLIEGKDTIGGGMRSAELTLPGFFHDICSAIHPLALGSPFFRKLPLAEYGLEWVQPPAALAHPFDADIAVTLERSIEATSEQLGKDSSAYQNLVEPIVQNWNNLAVDLLGPLQMPKHPLAVARFALKAIRSAEGLAKSCFKGEPARGFFAGMAAHSILPLNRAVTAGFGLVLDALGHTVGWPIAKGGSQQIANALASFFLSLGGEIVTGMEIKNLDQLPSAKIILFDVTPQQLLKIVGDQFPLNYKKRVEKYRYGPGIFKMDWALNAPIPWKAKECLRAGTVHIGGTLEEIALSEQEVWDGKHPERPFVLLAQQSLFDPSRAPKGKQTAWGYCHVPNGSTFDMSQRIEAQIERFAPGFKDCILARKKSTAMDLEKYNPNNVGGDINGGVQDLYQFFTRPVASLIPYATPIKGLYICSSSTPPGGGVHGMCGFHAAQAAMKKLGCI